MAVSLHSPQKISTGTVGDNVYHRLLQRSPGQLTNPAKIPPSPADNPRSQSASPPSCPDSQRPRPSGVRRCGAGALPVPATVPRGPVSSLGVSAVCTLQTGQLTRCVCGLYPADRSAHSVSLRSVPRGPVSSLGESAVCTPRTGQLTR